MKPNNWNDYKTKYGPKYTSKGDRISRKVKYKRLKIDIFDTLLLGGFFTVLYMIAQIFIIR